MSTDQTIVFVARDVAVRASLDSQRDRLIDQGRDAPRACERHSVPGRAVPLAPGSVDHEIQLVVGHSDRHAATLDEEVVEQ